MARPRKNKPVVDHLLVHEEPKTEWQRALTHVEDNYKLYIAGAVFLLLCIAIGALIRASAVVKEREESTLYAEAALEEDAGERLIKYEKVVNSLGHWTPEALYRMGETAIEAEEYDKAETLFKQLTTDYPNCEYIPNAVDGLAFVAWNKGDLEAALKGFEQVVQNWPGEFVGRRKYYDIGQVLEEMERIEDAIAAYKKQVALFPESVVAKRAQQSLDELKEEHPDLFPEEEGETEGEVSADLTATEGSAAEGESSEAPAAEAALVVEETAAPVEATPETPAAEAAPVVEETAAPVEAAPEASVTDTP